jgi:hypothetical protein
MKSYSSFLVRWWLISNEAERERNVLEIEHIQTGEHHKGASITEAEGWMLSRCQVPPTASRHSNDSADKPERQRRRTIK